MTVFPFDDPPFDPDHAPYDGSEAEVTGWLLDYHRWVLLKKVDGITDEQARRTTAASDLHLLGLIRHAVNVEQYWFDKVLRGIEPAWFFDDDDDPDFDFHPGPDDTLADAVEALRGEIGRNRGVAALTSFDTIAAGTREGRAVSFRWIMVHLVEEYARHCGHADLIREAVDGVTGD